MMDISRRGVLQLIVGTILAPALSRVAVAQGYPTKPIRLIIPFAPGGSYDAVGRPWAEKMKSLLGTVVIENIGGSGSSIGAAAAARASPDGYTLLLGGTLSYVNEILVKRHPLYNPAKDLAPILSLAVNCIAYAVHPSLPVQTLAQLIAYAKANPGKLSYGHAGIGTTNHLSGELFKSLTATPEIVQVPYRGAGPAIADLIGGQVQMAVPAMTAQVLELHRAGRIRILAVTSPARLALAPDLPTIAEEGYGSMTWEGSYGLFAPAGTPSSIIERVGDASRAALELQTFQRLLRDAGFEPTVGSNAETFRRSLEQAVAFWSPVVRSLDLKID
jgi:tripartite-type tricarboxylate transporter receptor subunit TctC